MTVVEKYSNLNGKYYQKHQFTNLMRFDGLQGQQPYRPVYDPSIEWDGILNTTEPKYQSACYHRKINAGYLIENTIRYDSVFTNTIGLQDANANWIWSIDLGPYSIWLNAQNGFVNNITHIQQYAKDVDYIWMDFQGLTRGIYDATTGTLLATGTSALRTMSHDGWTTTTNSTNYWRKIRVVPPIFDQANDFPIGYPTGYNRDAMGITTGGSYVYIALPFIASQGSSIGFGDGQWKLGLFNTSAGETDDGFVWIDLNTNFGTSSGSKRYDPKYNCMTSDDGLIYLGVNGRGEPSSVSKHNLAGNLAWSVNMSAHSSDARIFKVDASGGKVIVSGVNLRHEGDTSNDLHCVIALDEMTGALAWSSGDLNEGRHLTLVNGADDREGDARAFHSTQSGNEVCIAGMMLGY